MADAVKILARAHQAAIWSRQRPVNALRSALREYYPAALAAFGPDLPGRDAVAVLATAPSPEAGRALSQAKIAAALRRADAITGKDRRSAAAGGRLRNIDQRAQEIRADYLHVPPAVVAAYARPARSAVRLITGTPGPGRRLRRIAAPITLTTHDGVVRPEVHAVGAMQRISYVPVEEMDADMQAEMDRCRREGTPRPESSAIRAHVPACFWGFARSWGEIFRQGVCDHRIKELCRIYISRSVKCEYCGNQRSVQAAEQGITEGKYDELMNFERSERFDDREKAALAYAEAIAWHLPDDDALWDRMHRHFSEPELVELGCFIALTFGQQSWLRLLNIEHHQVLAGTDASMAPGFETAENAAATKQSAGYWARG